MKHLLDLERFPLAGAESPERARLVERCRADLAEHGMYNLDGFVPPSVVRQCLAETLPLLESEAFEHRRDHNIYFDDKIAGLEPDHPALAHVQTTNHTICADQIADSALTRIYEWPPLARFLEDTLDMPKLHTMADPLARMNVLAYRDGEALNWHFDRSEFTTTLLLQGPEAGGQFQFRKDLRSDSEPNFEGVGRLLEGKDEDVRTLSVEPGTLNVFRGRNTAHQVTPVEGARDRVIAVFSYYEKPGVMFSDEERVGFYGRAG